jgi:hypothetical protein
LHRKFEDVGIIPAVDESLLQYPNGFPHGFVDKTDVCAVGAVDIERINDCSDKLQARVRWVGGCDMFGDGQFMFCQGFIDVVVAADLECNKAILLPVPPAIVLV